MEEVREPSQLQVLRGHRGEVTCVDAAGAVLASGGGAGDRSLRLWRWVAARGWEEAARVAVAHRYGVTAARFGPGGALLASAGVDGCVRVWSGRGLEARRALAAPGAAAVRALCWAGRRLLAGHDDGALCVWHVARGELLARLRAFEGALHAVAAPAHCALLLMACTDGVLKVFDLAEVCRGGVEDGAAPAPLTWLDGAHDLGALCADAADDGAAVATGGHDALVRLWRAAGRGLAPAGALAGHGAAVTALRWARGSALLLSASLDRTARLWAPAALACLHVLRAHERFLTCVAFAPDLSYVITGSNDKSVRMWSLGSLKLEDDLEPSCVALDHFALGDLDGIGPLDEQLDELPEDTAALGGARCEWRAAPGGGPINSIAAHGDLVATASSDGAVRLYRWRAADGAGALEEAAVLRAHQYPALAVDFGAAGALLLSAGLDGRAVLWDSQSGVELRVLSAGEAGEAGGAGGGGVRGARVSPRRPTQLLLATDDGLAPLWGLDSSDPRPSYVCASGPEALLCCAWSRDARAVALGGAGGELRVLRPGEPRAAHVTPTAHDGGVQSCDFTPSSADFGLSESEHLLATAGSDSYIKLWVVEIMEEGGAVPAVRLARQVAAHGGGAACVRWRGPLLASAGADDWARVWCAAPRGEALREAGAACAAGAGGVLAVALLSAELLLTGTLAGELALWRLPEAEGDEGGEADDEGAPPALWGPAGVTRWLRENVTRAPGTRVTLEEEEELIRKSREAGVTGSQLVNAPVDELLQNLGYGVDESPGGTEASEETTDTSLQSADATREGADEEGRWDTRARLRHELAWLRRAPPAALRAAPHALQCPLSHRPLAEPVCAADGYTYERANILDWFIAAGGAVSPVSGRRLRNARLSPNYALRDLLRQRARDLERSDGDGDAEPL